MTKRFNTLKAKEIVNKVIDKSSYKGDEHKFMHNEARKAIYDYFGWTKGAVRFINNKLPLTIMEHSKFIPLKAW